MAYHRVITLTDFLLETAKKNKQYCSELTIILTQIENASKIIASHVQRTGLVDILGKAGSINSYGEEVKKLDQFADQLFCDLLSDIPEIFAFASEERESFEEINSQGKFTVFFDPLDGSSNIDSNISIGSIFSIYKKQITEKNLAKVTGNEQVASGYVMYGSSVMFVLSVGSGVHGFTLDPSIGNFILTNPNMKIPSSGKVYSINEAYYLRFSKKDRDYLDSVKKKSMKLRYVGSMIADVHRTFIQGGIFLYPADTKNLAGKLRLLFEVNPISYLIAHSDGKAVSNTENPLAIPCKKLHQRVPIVLGSKKLVEEYNNEH